MDNRVWYTGCHDARLTAWTHGVGMGMVHPIVPERLLRLALRLRLVAASHHIHRSRGVELVAEVAVHLGRVRFLVAHDEHLTTKPVHILGEDEYTHKKL